MFKYTFACWGSNETQIEISVFTNEGLRAAELKVEKVHRMEHRRLKSIEEQYIGHWIPTK